MKQRKDFPASMYHMDFFDVTKRGMCSRPHDHTGLRFVFIATGPESSVRITSLSPILTEPFEDQVSHLCQYLLSENLNADQQKAVCDALNEILGDKIPPLNVENLISEKDSLIKAIAKHYTTLPDTPLTHSEGYNIESLLHDIKSKLGASNPLDGYKPLTKDKDLEQIQGKMGGFKDGVERDSYTVVVPPNSHFAVQIPVATSHQFNAVGEYAGIQSIHSEEKLEVEREGMTRSNMMAQTRFLIPDHPDLKECGITPDLSDTKKDIAPSARTVIKLEELVVGRDGITRPKVVAEIPIPHYDPVLLNTLGMDMAVQALSTPIKHPVSDTSTIPANHQARAKGWSGLAAKATLAASLIGGTSKVAYERNSEVNDFHKANPTALVIQPKAPHTNADSYDMQGMLPRNAEKTTLYLPGKLYDLAKTTPEALDNPEIAAWASNRVTLRKVDGELDPKQVVFKYDLNTNGVSSIREATVENYQKELGYIKAQLAQNHAIAEPIAVASR